MSHFIEYGPLRYEKLCYNKIVSYYVSLDLSYLPSIISSMAIAKVVAGDVVD